MLLGAAGLVGGFPPKSAAEWLLVHVPGLLGGLLYVVASLFELADSVRSLPPTTGKPLCFSSTTLRLGRG